MQSNARLGSSLFKTNNYGKYTLHLSCDSYHWMVVRLFRFSCGRHHPCFTCSCSYCNSNKAYSGKERLIISPSPQQVIVPWKPHVSRIRCFTKALYNRRLFFHRCNSRYIMQSVSVILADSSAIAKPLLCSQSSIRTEYI